MLTACVGSRLVVEAREPLPRVKAAKVHNALILSSRVQKRVVIDWLRCVFAPFIFFFEPQKGIEWCLTAAEVLYATESAIMTRQVTRG
jgi:hypothetical protein